MADPRLGQAAKTINQLLLEDSILRNVSIERLKNRLVRDLVGFLNDELLPDILGKLQRLESLRSRGADSGVWQMQRYKDVLASIKDAIDAATAEARANFLADATEFASLEAKWQTKQLEDATEGLNLDFVGPSKATLNAIVSTEPFEGQVIRGWFQDLSDDTLRRVSKAIDLGLAQGETVDEMARRIRGTRDNAYQDGLFEATRVEAERLVRTGVAHVSTRAREQTFSENSDIVKGVTWTSTLDDRTCVVCGNLDGETFDIGDGPRPPAHPNCRCSMVPALKSWKELGIDLNEAPDGTRASMDGEVPEAMTYAEWLESQPQSVQEDVLGVRKAAAFRAGTYSLGDFSTDRGRILSLRELAAQSEN